MGFPETTDTSFWARFRWWRKRWQRRHGGAWIRHETGLFPWRWVSPEERGVLFTIRVSERTRVLVDER